MAQHGPFRGPGKSTERPMSPLARLVQPIVFWVLYNIIIPESRLSHEATRSAIISQCAAATDYPGESRSLRNTSTASRQRRSDAWFMSTTPAYPRPKNVRDSERILPRSSAFDVWFRPKGFESERLYERLGALLIKRYVPTGGDLVMQRLRRDNPGTAALRRNQNIDSCQCTFQRLPTSFYDTIMIRDDNLLTRGPD
jgi:hypothetical protein